MRRKILRNDDLSFLPYFHSMVGTKPPDEFLSNGSSWSPDVIFGIDIRPATHWHDYAYSAEHERKAVHNEDTRYRADQLFRLNLRTCGIRILTYVYYYRVRFWGHFAYHYSRGAEPRRNFRFWLRLFFGRYITW